jgi:hypothetical protein
MSCSQINSSLLGDKVDCGIGLSYRLASHQPDGPVRQPYAIVDFIPPVRDYELAKGAVADVLVLNVHKTPS